MRLINLENVREGMILGRTIYGPNGEVYLRHGMIIKDAYISSLRRLDYSSIYINDALSEGIDIAEPVTSEQRSKSVSAVKKVFTYTMTSTNKKLHFTGLSEAVNDMIDQIIANTGTLDNLTTLKTYDDYTFQHSVNVCVIAILLGSKMELSKNELKYLGMAAILHDIGKIAVPYEIINKPSSLTAEEYDMIKLHPQLGGEIIKDSQIFPPEVHMAVCQHHERPDGKGYSNRLHDEEIHVYAKIIALADVYDAITSKRSYKDSMHTFEAYEYIMSQIGTQFDAILTPLFLKNIAPFPIGTCVRLSNNEIGIVIRNNEYLMLRPCIRLADKKGIIDLSSSETLSITITEIIE